MPHSSPERILVVDDDEEIRRLYTELLVQHGYRVDTAADGEAAWKALQAAQHHHEDYNLLITDCQMPKFSGVGLVGKLRAARMTLPVILASSAPPVNIGELQFAAVLTKPFPPKQLLQIVKNVLPL